MRRARWSRFWFAVCLLAVASPARSDDSTGTVARRGVNVRPFFSVGPTMTHGFDPIDRGYGVDLGFETEQSRRVSLLFRLSWNRVRDLEHGAKPVLYFYDPSELTVLDWSLGARLHLGDGARARAYTEACLGIRSVSDMVFGLGLIPGGLSSPNAYVKDSNGLAMTLRLGATLGPRGGAAIFFDGGLEFLLSDPKHYGIAPIRLGVLFP